eukprot:1160868-Pelagomonas_calceolata.AAC.7
MGFLPLHLAAYHGSMGVLKQLLEGVEAKSDILGCSINCQDYQVRVRGAVWYGLVHACVRLCLCTLHCACLEDAALGSHAGPIAYLKALVLPEDVPEA